MRKVHFILFSFLSFAITSCSQTEPTKIDTLEFQMGYPKLRNDALEQLKSYPQPRYQPHNDFLRMYNWMSPYYAGGAGQEGAINSIAIERGAKIQEELAVNWNYYLVIPNPRIDSKENMFKDPSSPLSSFVNLANRHPELPLSVTVFWGQMNPYYFGASRLPNILRQDLPERYYLKEARINKKSRVISYAAPDSLFIKDGMVQQKQLSLLIKHLTRPINFINENGEEPPRAYSEQLLKNDSLLIDDKNKLKIDKWDIYIATKKKHMRQLYSSQFMDKIPELKNAYFTFYKIEGGPIDCYDWNASKATNSRIKGNYYSTPDFYTRTPDNWKAWKGAWHGWKWINDGRKVEIKAGDKFFSPYVAAGWAYNPEEDMRPAQWLGLLKCLSVVGAEFYYTGYFNLGKPVSKPENYIWQAAMPAYAQAVTTHFADVFRNGNVVFDSKGNPIVTYPVSDNDVLVTVRKHDAKQQYIIATTVQPSSNRLKFALEKNVEVKIDGETFIIKSRRQGSVYFLDKTTKPYVFYQLDRWHQYEHPSRWRKELIYEAEVKETSSANLLIESSFKMENDKMDFSSSEAFVSLHKHEWVGYAVSSRDVEQLGSNVQLMMFIKNASPVSGEIRINDYKKTFTAAKNENWNWIKMEIPKDVFLKEKTSILKIVSSSENLELDKLVISDANSKAVFSEY